tara:strand:- start:1062 stop:3971 length:2910 start_codon:yes stop_codon:yes gene_type:complete
MKDIFQFIKENETRNEDDITQEEFLEALLEIEEELDAFELEESVELDEKAPKIKGDWLKQERERNNKHDAAMGRTKTGRKKPTRTMTSTQKSLASMRGESVELDENVLGRYATAGRKMRKRDDAAKNAVQAAGGKDPRTNEPKTPEEWMARREYHLKYAARKGMTQPMKDLISKKTMGIHKKSASECREIHNIITGTRMDAMGNWKPNEKFAVREYPHKTPDHITREYNKKKHQYRKRLQSLQTSEHEDTKDLKRRTEKPWYDAMKKHFASNGMFSDVPKPDPLDFGITWDIKDGKMPHRPYMESVELDEASEEGKIRVIDLSDAHPNNRMGAKEKSGYQVQRMTKGKFVNQGKPYKKYADAKKVQQGTGQHSMQFEEKSGTGYELYHRDFSGAMGHAYAHAKKKFGITVDSDEIDDKVAMGPRKPGNGKTNTYRLKGDKGNIQVQVYNRGGSKPFELNMYKESVIEDAEMIIENVSPKQIAMLKKQYSSMPDRLPLDQAMKMSKMVAKFDKASLMKVAKADIKWLSSAAKTNLISKHSATAKDFKESVELDEASKPAKVFKYEFKNPKMVQDIDDFLKKSPNAISKDLYHHYNAQPFGRGSGASRDIWFYQVKDIHAFNLEFKSKVLGNISGAKNNMSSKADGMIIDRLVKESVELDESKWEYQDARGVTKTGSLSKTVERQGTDVSYIFKGDDGKTDVVSGSRLKKMKKIKESVIDEAVGALGMESAAKALEKYAKAFGGPDEKDFMIAARLLRKGLDMKLKKFVNDMDTEPREKVITTMAKTMGKKPIERMFSVRLREIDEAKTPELKGNPFKYYKKPANKKEAQSNVNFWHYVGMADNDEIEDMGKIPANYKSYAKSMKQDAQRELKKMNEAVEMVCEDCGCEPNQPQEGCECPNDNSDLNGDHWVVKGEDGMNESYVPEKLGVGDGMKAWIADFKKSDAPQFKGASADKRRKMAYAAYMDAKRG